MATVTRNPVNLCSSSFTAIVAVSVVRSHYRARVVARCHITRAAELLEAFGGSLRRSDSSCIVQDRSACGIPDTDYPGCTTVTRPSKVS